MNVIPNGRILLYLLIFIGLSSCQNDFKKTVSSEKINQIYLVENSDKTIEATAQINSLAAGATGVEPTVFTEINREPIFKSTSDNYIAHNLTIKENKIASYQTRSGNIKNVKKELRKEIKQIKKKANTNYAIFSKGAGIALIVGGLVLIVLGIAFLNSLGVLLGSILAGVGVIVFLLGFLGLIL